MGRPFDEVVDEIPEALRFSFESDIDKSLNTIISNIWSLPLLVIGSGGSLSAANFIARVHEQMTGNTAKAVSPLEMAFSQVDPYRHAVLMLTASGNNKDILDSFDMAVAQEFAYIGVVCASQGSKISKRALQYTAQVNCFEYQNPYKDGFLAVNSLLSMCVLLCRGYGAFETLKTPKIFYHAKPTLDYSQLSDVLDRTTKVALGGEWSLPAVADLESKFSEAALGNVLVSDLRNFGHGRHNWFDKRGAESSLIILETPELKNLSVKTLSALPEIYPRIVLSTSFSGPLATIDLMRQVAYLTQEAGKRLFIDPGKPGVPEFGRKIYHIGASLRSTRTKTKNRAAWLRRKSFEVKAPIYVVEEFLDVFLSDIEKCSFGGIVFDYDGTLCDPSERFVNPRQAVGELLNNLLLRGVVVGIATGRGKSVRIALRNIIAKEFWRNCHVGNYNGSVILPLTNDLPNYTGQQCPELIEVCNAVRSDPFLTNYVTLEERFRQVTVIPKSVPVNQSVLRRLSEIVTDFKDVKILQSGHSIDLMDRGVSKRLVVESMQRLTAKEVMVIGDQGQLGGNDFEMLSVRNSLSVNRVSASLSSCWNLSPSGLRGVKATLAIMKCFNIDNHCFQFDVVSLEKERG